MARQVKYIGSYRVNNSLFSLRARRVIDDQYLARRPRIRDNGDAFSMVGAPAKGDLHLYR